MAVEQRHPGTHYHTPRRRSPTAWCALVVVLVALASTVVGLQSAGGQALDREAMPALPPLPADSSLRSCESWSRCAVPGLREIHLTGLTPPVARTMVVTVADIARAFGAEVPLLVPVSAWEAATDTSALDALMFANAQGIAFDPTRLDDYGKSGDSLGEIARFTAHEMGHVLQASGHGMDGYASDEVVRHIVTNFRERLGEDEIVAELGTYAWSGSSTQPERAWTETWAEAFSLYWTAPDELAAPAAEMVAEVLGALGLR